MQILIENILLAEIISFLTVLRMKAIISHIEYSVSKDVTFVRCKPENLFSFKEWQFMMISSDFIHEWVGKPLKKPYSIATTSHELQSQWTIGFVVKKSREWFMSDYLTYWIQIWDIIHLQWPVGHMIDSWVHDNYLLISVGSGLSPMIGLYESIVAKQQPTTKIAMLYGERYLYHVLPSTLGLFSKISSNTKNVLFLSRENEIQSSEFKIQNYKDGYVQSWLDEAMEFLGTKEVSVFICGKPEMVDDVREKLIGKWVDAKNVKFEKY